jgi:NADPH:quinone reductase-like Zn-dependent oxidoreductase
MVVPIGHGNRGNAWLHPSLRDGRGVHPRDWSTRITGRAAPIDAVVAALGHGELLWTKSSTYDEPCARRLADEIPGGAQMKAVVVTDRAAGTAGMRLAERPQPEAAGNDVLVEVHASGFTPGELTWPGTWTDRLGRDRTPSIPGHEVAGVVSALGYGTRGLSVGQRVFGLTDWTRDGTLAEYVAVEARNLAPLPGDVDFTVGASLPISGLTAWQGLFVHGRFRVGQTVLVHGAAGGVGSMATQLAHQAGAYVIGTGRAIDRQDTLDLGAREFVDLDNDTVEDVGAVDLVFDVIGGDIGKRSAALVRAGGMLVTIAGPPEVQPTDGPAVDFVVEADRPQLAEVVQRVREGRLRANIGRVADLDDAVAALNPTARVRGKTIIRVRPPSSPSRSDGEPAHRTRSSR